MKNNICTWIIIVLLDIYLILKNRFLEMFSDWWFWLSYSGVLLTIILLIYLYEKRIKYIKAIKIATIIFLCAWNLLYIYAYYNVTPHKTIHTIVSLRGYGIRRREDVLFSYKGYKFDKNTRVWDAVDKYGEDLIHKCKLELSLCEVNNFPYLYYINYIHIVEKDPRPER